MSVVEIVGMGKDTSVWLHNKKDKYYHKIAIYKSNEKRKLTNESSINKKKRRKKKKENKIINYQP